MSDVQKAELTKSTYPAHDLNSLHCWCEPRVIWRDPETGGQVILHRVWQ